MDCRPIRRNKAAFSNFSGVVWARPHFRLSPKALDRDDIKRFLFVFSIMLQAVFSCVFYFASVSLFSGFLMIG